MKKWLDRYDKGGQAPARDNTTVYRNVLPISMPQPKPAYINPTPDYKDSEWYKQESEDFKTRRNITQPVLHAADVATDVMQLGNFIPLPQAQAIARTGNILGALVDSYQAGDAFVNKDYNTATMNAAAALLPLYMRRNEFARDMYNTVPGSLADKIASYGSRNGTYLPLSGVRKNLIKNPIMRKAVDNNKKTFGALLTETGYDSYAEGGESINIINTPGSLNIMDRPENRRGDQNVFNRAASFLEYENKMKNAIPVSLNPRVTKQNQIITSLPNNGKNYAIVDKKADSIFYFTPEGKNITGEPIITGASRNDVDKGLSMKEWAAQTGDNNHEHYFEYLKQNGLQTTPSGIFHLNTLRTDVAQDPNKWWRAFNNAVRPERAEHVFESRIKDYGPRQLMFTFSDENNKPSSKAIHGTAREERLNAFNNLEKDRGLSNGCINVNGKTICFNALETGSNLYVLPEKSDKYLYPQKKMDVNTLSPLNKYYEQGGDTTDYNFAAWQLADPIRASYHVVNPEDFHGPDQYKYPNHMTFSDESMYSTPEHMGGHWTELKNGKWQFQPSQWNIQNAGGKEKFLNWWNQGEGKVGNKVKFDYGGSFGSAFAQARKDLGAGKIFSWNGKQYTTNFAEEQNNVSNDVPVKRYTAPVRQPELIDNNAEMANIADQRMQYYNQQKKNVVPIPYPVPVKSQVVSNKKSILNNPFLNLTPAAQPNAFANLKPSYDNLAQFAYNPAKEEAIPVNKTDNKESSSFNARLFINGIKRNISKLFGDDESSATKIDLSKAKANVINKTNLGNKPIASPEFENTYNVPRITGDTLWDDKNAGVYHMPMIVDLNQQSFGHRSRNDRTDVKSPGYLFGAIDDSRNFRHFVNAKTSQLDPDQFYSGVDPTTNKIRIQKGKWFQGKNIDVLPHQGFENVVGLAKDKENKFVLKSAHGAATSYWTPEYIHSDNTVYGSPGLLMHKHQKDAGYYGNITGGNVVLTTPDFKRQIYVSGSVNDINNAIEQFKKTTGSKVINAVTVDNGSYARNYLKANNHISAEDWYNLDNRNTSGGLGYYMLPDNEVGGEFEAYANGGEHGGLDRWFAEKWVDVKTGKQCGRQEGEKRRGYPACRPSKRVSSETPKTASELSSSEKEKFKRNKTSSKRISYQHRRMEDGGQIHNWREVEVPHTKNQLSGWLDKL